MVKGGFKMDSTAVSKGTTAVYDFLRQHGAAL
jgi:hypothetical protein